MRNTPNQLAPHVGSTGPTSRSGSPVRRGPSDPGTRQGSGAGRQASPVKAPDHRFRAQGSKMPQPPSVVSPGQGAIPVTPAAGSTGPDILPMIRGGK